jgi:hypothetical protein
MKHLHFLFIIFFVSINSYSQKFLNENSTFIDFSNNEINLSVNENSFIGKFEKIKINYKEYIIISNNAKTLLLDFGVSLPTEFDKYFIENVIVINSNDIAQIKKIIEKNNSYIDKKIEIDYEGKNDKIKYIIPDGEYKFYWGGRFVSEKRIEKERLKKEETQNKIDAYDKISNLKEIEGVYEISLFKFQGVELNSNNKGKLYISDEGVSLITDLSISENILRGSHIKDSFYTPSGVGQFYCKVIKGFWEEFTCSINIITKSGAIISSKGKENRTTTFTILKKLD